MHTLDSTLQVDREIFRIKHTRDEFIVTDVVHSYPQVTTKEDALFLLEREANRIIAEQIAEDLLDDILEWMAEGWYFGKRESRLPPAT